MTRMTRRRPRGRRRHRRELLLGAAVGGRLGERSTVAHRRTARGGVEDRRRLRHVGLRRTCAETETVAIA